MPGRRMTAAAAALLTLLSVLLVGQAPTASAASATVTRTALLVQPGTSVTTQTAVSLVASVEPAGAAGFVVFTGGGRTLASAAVVGGRATVGNLYLAVGILEVVATFTPNDASAFTPSASGAVQISSRDVPNVWLTEGSGEIVAGSAPLTPGTSYAVNVSGFPAGAPVALRLAGRELSPGIVADSRGAGVAPLALPAAPGVYTLEASSGALVTAVVFYVVPPAADAGSAPAGPVPSQPGQQSATTGTAVAASPGSLASTGAEPFGPGAAGLALLALGVLLVRAGDAPRHARRH